MGRKGDIMISSILDYLITDSKECLLCANHCALNHFAKIVSLNPTILEAGANTVLFNMYMKKLRLKNNVQDNMENDRVRILIYVL